MQEFDKECLQVFLERQTQLFPEPVAETMRETREFLEESMAVVLKSQAEVKQYFEESGVDTSGMSLEELLSQNEVFPLQKTGRYLIVEG